MWIGDYDKIIGLTVEDVFVEKQNQNDCVLKTDKGYFKITLGSDCCSESFIGDVLKADKGKVIRVEDIELIEGESKDENIYGVPTRESRQEVDKLFGIKIVLEDFEHKCFGPISRSVILSFRNASNGYYGGWVEDVELIDDFNEGDYIRITETPKSFF